MAGEPVRPDADDGGGDASATSEGVDVEAIEGSTAATVKAAQWLLGTAGALVPIVVAGVQLTRLGDALESALDLSLAMMALVAAAAVICMVLVRATAVLKIPYADLSEVLQIRSDHNKSGVWDDGVAQQRWDRASQVAVAGSGGKLAGVPQLHAEIQRLRAASQPDDGALARAEGVARLVVAHLNRVEIEQRFEKLRNWYIAAVLVVLTAVTVFVVATSLAPGEVSVETPVAVSIQPKDGTWPGALAKCDETELKGVAVSGSWPSPDVSVARSGSCKSTLIRRSEGIVVVPVLDEAAADDSPESGAVRVEAPARVVLYRTSDSWPAPSLGRCKARKLDAIAVGGTWTAPVAITRHAHRCPASVVEESNAVFAVPRAGGANRRGREND